MSFIDFDPLIVWNNFIIRQRTCNDHTVNKLMGPFSKLQILQGASYVSLFWFPFSY